MRDFAAAGNALSGEIDRETGHRNTEKNGEASPFGCTGLNRPRCGRSQSDTKLTSLVDLLRNLSVTKQFYVYIIPRKEGIVARPTQRLTRDLRSLGEHVAGWRKIQNLTAAMVAERAGITRDTLRAIENGDSTTTANLVSVLRVLGVFDTVLDALDPLDSDFGRANAHRLSRERVRT